MLTATVNMNDTHINRWIISSEHLAYNYNLTNESCNRPKWILIQSQRKYKHSVNPMFGHRNSEICIIALGAHILLQFLFDFGSKPV